MKSKSRSSGTSQPQLKVRDLNTKKDLRGGVRKAGKGQSEAANKLPGFK
jgi:hypothetical protein